MVQFIQPFYYFILLIILATVIKPKTYNIESSQEIFNTVSKVPTYTNDYFVDKDYVQTEFQLPNCTVDGYNATQIAVVVDQQLNSTESTYWPTLQTIFSEISEAYKINNKIIDEKLWLTNLTFDSVGDLQDYVKKKDYASNQLCFSYGFEQFEPSSNKFKFALYFDANQIPNTGIDQVAFQTSIYDVKPSGITSFSQQSFTGFEQLMTTATAAVLD